MKPIRLILGAVLLAAGFVVGFGYGRWYGPVSHVGQEQSKQRKILYYVDPMHPAYKSDKPGIAPDCGMKLEPVYEDGSAGSESKTDRAVSKYSDPQDPTYTSAKPGINPVTGNTPEPIYIESAGPLGTIQITPEKQQMIGMQFGVVEYTTAGESLRTVGKVAMDETRLVHVHSRLDGWVDRLYVDFTGASVHKGDPLLTLYSPEMLASQKEYLLALKARDVMRLGAIQGAVANSDTLIEASRRRLELYDLSKPQIEQLERTGEPIHATTVYSPASGFVVSRNSFPNLRVTPETELYTIADFSQVWIMADLFEADIPKVRIGQLAKVSVPGRPAGSFTARVDFIQPQLDPQTRTVKARLQASNAGGLLKPEMFVDVEFPLATTRQLTVPVDAVLDAGQRQTVFVDRGDGYLEPRQVEMGDRLGDRVVILSGLKAGERIVTSANFLIDSESQLKSAVAGMGRGQAKPASGDVPKPSDPAHEARP